MVDMIQVDRARIERIRKLAAGDPLDREDNDLRGCEAVQVGRRIERIVQLCDEILKDTKDE